MDPSTIIQLVVLIVLLLLSAFFSSSETALTTVSKIKLKTLADEGNKSASKVLLVTENPGKLLSTILIGNNIVNISASALATTFTTNTFGSKWLGVSTGIITILVLIFGEITPKTMAAQSALKISLMFVHPIKFLMFILTPVIWLLDRITGLIFTILRVDTSAKNTMTESELRAVVEVSHEDGVIEPEEKFMISNVVDFGDALSKDVMIPRADIVCADITSTYEELVNIFRTEKFSRIPIYEDSKDSIVGLLYLKDLFFYSQTHDMTHFDLKSILRQPIFVYEYQKTSQIFADMKTSSVTMAVVLDEYGATSGIITMEDLIEEIVGEIRDEYDDYEDDFIKKINDTQYDVDASIKLDDLNDALHTKLVSENYDSLGGLVIELLDKLPDEGETATFKNISLLVTKVHKNRIERITMTITPEENENE